MRLRVVVADDNDAFLAAARDVLAAGGLDVVAAVGTGDEVLAACEAHQPEVAVLDVQMPGGGPHLAAEITRRWPETRILCLSARDDAETVLGMLAGGAIGYVAKGALVEDLATVVRRCADGGLFVTAGCAPEVRRRIGEMVGGSGRTA